MMRVFGFLLTYFAGGFIGLSVGMNRMTDIITMTSQVPKLGDWFMYAGVAMLIVAFILNERK